MTKLGHYPHVLGIPWLQHHDVSIRFTANKVTFDSERCCKHHNQGFLGRFLHCIPGRYPYYSSTLKELRNTCG